MINNEQLTLFCQRIMHLFNGILVIYSKMLAYIMQMSAY